MKQIELIEKTTVDKTRFDLARGYVVHLPRGPRSQGDLYHHGHHIKRVNLADKAEMRLFAVEMMQKNISQTRLAEVLNVSRQTLHNYRESYREFGVNGLLHGYSPAKSKSEELQRRVHVDKRRPGSKTRELEALRRAKKEQTPAAVEDEFEWDGPARAIYTLQETAIEDVLPSAYTATKTIVAEDQSLTQSSVEQAEQSLPMAICTLQETAIEEVLPSAYTATKTIVAEDQSLTQSSVEQAEQSLPMAICTLQETAIEEVLPNACTATTVPTEDLALTPSGADQAEALPMANGSLQKSVIDTLPDIESSATKVAPKSHPEANPTGTALSLIPVIAPEKVSEIPYADNHGWEINRNAGVFPVLMVLIGQSPWLQRLFRLFGDGWRIFMVFVLMAVRNIRSIEQMKHERRDEAGRLLGVGHLPALDGLWGWFHDAANKRRSGVLLEEFFADQIRCGRVSTRLWFTDGHLLPYSGQEKVHAAWSTQRRMPMSGQTNLVTSDEQGRVVNFDIQEGHGDLRDRIHKLGEYARQQSLGVPPVHVFDREGDGLAFFSKLVRAGTPFITWEKNANQAHLMALQSSDFTDSVQFNGTDYRLLEEVKSCVYKPVAESGVESQEHCFKLRRVVLWNLRTEHRVNVLCWDGERKLSSQEVACGMLARWGASENTFKHIQERHPYHYHPGFGVTQSEKQDIANPEIKVFEKKLNILQKKLGKLYKKLTKTQPVHNQDGSERMNSLHRRLTQEIATSEEQQNMLKANKAKLTDRIDVTGLADYRSFKAIDNEGKNLFDFVTTSVWNARRLLLDWLGESYAKDNDRVDLLYAIFNCQGWIRSDEQWVVVRMEPLQQPARRSAQEQLCRKLTGLGAKIPGGKWLRVEVGDSPM